MSLRPLTMKQSIEAVSYSMSTYIKQKCIFFKSQTKVLLIDNPSMLVGNCQLTQQPDKCLHLRVNSDCALFKTHPLQEKSCSVRAND